MNKRLKTALRIIPVVLLSGVLLVAATRPVVATVPGNNIIVSVNNSGDGQGGNSHSGSVSRMSSNGRFVAFDSKATNIVANDANGKQDVFLRDLKTNVTTRISVTSTGAEMSNDSYVAAISSTGRYILFNYYNTASTSTVYMHDRVAATTTLINAASGTGIGPGGAWNDGRGVSSDGRFVLINGVTSGYWHVFVLDTVLNTWTILDPPHSRLAALGSTSPNSQMSCDGALVVFESDATTLTSDTPNGYTNVFLLDRRAGDRLTNLTATGGQASANPVISCNGDYVGFVSKATNITSGVSTAPYGHYYWYDRINEQFSLVDQTTGGTIFDSNIWRTSSHHMQIDDSGNVVFAATTSNFDYYNIPGQIYFRNMSSQTTERLSKSSSATYANNGANVPSISASGKEAAFSSSSTNLVASDTNGRIDIFLAETGL